MSSLKLGFCPTRRDVFSRTEALKYRELILRSVQKHQVDIVDLSGINEEGLLCSQTDLEAVIDRFVREKVDAVFFPHCNFGSESLVSQVARALDVPVLVWGPRDDAPDAEGIRNRDTQCGLFATGKVLRRHNVAFTYLTNSTIDSADFHRGFEKFLAVSRVVKAIRNLRILQISTRPEPFSSVICNENELLEQFNIHLYPVALPDITSEMKRIQEKGEEDYRETVAAIQEADRTVSRNSAEMAAALKEAMKHFAHHYGCQAIAIQCWSALQAETGIMPCLANALLTEEGIPVACETDIHGAVTAVMLQAASESVPFFADVTIRHPDNDNAELLWHCGNFPPSLAKDRHAVSFCGNPYMADENFGIVQNRLRDGTLTLTRFDGDHGSYRLLLGEVHTTEGPHNRGSYVWIETGDWVKWEHHLVEGPYIHHVSGAYGNYADILAEACKYIPGLEPDPVDPDMEELTRRWW